MAEAVRGASRIAAGHVLYEATMPVGLRRAPTSRVLIAIALFGVVACKQDPAPQGDAAPKPKDLPSLVVKADTPNLLITWIDEKGDFKVVTKPADVPSSAREKVRIAIADKEVGTGDSVYVTNLNESAPDGSFRLATLSRAAWEELGASRRSARLEALAPPTTSAPAAPSAAPSGELAKKAPVSGVQAIIYGASWCKPCHDAERYLKQRGVNVVKKDVEENESAAAEMKRKLDRAGLAGASIPVIDIMGRVMQGFSVAALDRAIEAARGSKGI
jgi:glutaredoxin